MTHRQSITRHITSHSGWCDDCLSRDLGIQPRQTVNRLCSMKGSGIARSRGSCASCGKHKVLNHIDTTVVPVPQPVLKSKRTKRSIGTYVREEDLRSRFNASLIETLGVAAKDYYGGLDFVHLLRLKEGLARIHDIVTLKLTSALVEKISKRLGLSGKKTSAMHQKVNAIHPNASGFDIDWEEPNLIGEVKGCIPVNGGNVFGAAQLKGLTSDVFQMLGQAGQGKQMEKLAKNSKIHRPRRAESIKLLGLYDSSAVRSAVMQWRESLMNHSDWKPLCPATIEDLPDAGDLTPTTVYIVYLNPAHSRSF